MIAASRLAGGAALKVVASLVGLVACAAGCGSGAAPGSTASGSWSRLMTAPVLHLAAISCPIERFCVAVDGSSSVLTYHGQRWSPPTAVVGPAHGVGSGLRTVSCPTPEFCVAADGQGEEVTFSASGWSSPIRIDNDGLDSVSCASASLCIAIDSSGRAVYWRGVSWSSPSDIPNSGQVIAVSCPTSTFCMAIDGINGATYAFDGTRWTPRDSIRGSTPSGGSEPDEPSAISCIGTQFCALDGFGEAFTWSPDRWRGPVPFDPNSFGINAVSCATARFCLAVMGGMSAHIWRSDLVHRPTGPGSERSLRRLLRPGQRLFRRGEQRSSLRLPLLQPLELRPFALPHTRNRSRAGCAASGLSVALLDRDHEGGQPTASDSLRSAETRVKARTPSGGVPGPETSGSRPIDRQLATSVQSSGIDSETRTRVL